MDKPGCQRRNRACKKVLCPSYLDCVDGLIWKFHKELKMRLTRITTEISDYTNWDEIFTLVYVVGFLTSRGVEFTRAKLYYAIGKLFNDEFHFKFQKKDVLRGAGFLRHG